MAKLHVSLVKWSSDWAVAATSPVQISVRKEDSMDINFCKSVDTKYWQSSKDLPRVRLELTAFRL